MSFKMPYSTYPELSMMRESPYQFSQVFHGTSWTHAIYIVLAPTHVSASILNSCHHSASLVGGLPSFPHKILLHTSRLSVGY